MSNYQKKGRSTNKAINDLTAANYFHVDGSTASQTIIATTLGARLIRATLNTNGNAVSIKSGSRLIATIASDAPEGDFDYGIYCADGIQVESAGAVSLTIVFA